MYQVCRVEDGMNRLGFVQRVLAALGVAGFVHSFEVEKPATSSPPAPPCHVCLGEGEIQDHPVDGDFDWANVTFVPCPRCRMSEKESAEFFVAGKRLIFWDGEQRKWLEESPLRDGWVT